jgi:hypothetical protein
MVSNINLELKNSLSLAISPEEKNEVTQNINISSGLL